MYNFKDVPRAVILAALCNNAPVAPIALMLGNGSKVSVEQAQAYIRVKGEGYYDYVYGRPIKCNIFCEGALDLRLYLRDSPDPTNAILELATQP